MLVPHIFRHLGWRKGDHSLDEATSPALTITPSFVGVNEMVWKDERGIIVCGGNLTTGGLVPCDLWRIGASTLVAVNPVPYGEYTPLPGGKIWVGVTGLSHDSIQWE